MQEVCNIGSVYKNEVNDMDFLFDMLKLLLPDMDPWCYEAAYFLCQNTAIMDKVNTLLIEIQELEGEGLNLNAYSVAFGLVAGWQILLWASQSEVVHENIHKEILAKLRRILKAP